MEAAERNAEESMKKLFTTFAILAVICFGYQPAQAVAVPEGCYKVEPVDETFIFEAPTSGLYTFNGGSEGTSENGYLITVELSAGEVWVVPEVNGRPGAAISNVIICPTPIEPDCIHKDPATIRYGRDEKPDKFKMRGQLRPETPLTFDFGVRGILTDSVYGELVEFNVAASDIVVTEHRAKGRDEQTSFRIKFFRGGTYGLFLRHKGTILDTPDGVGQIVFDLFVDDKWFQVHGQWTKRKNGWFLSNKNFVCGDVTEWQK